jgi:xanthine dehydrogenase YagR molybdenum-binding subunit
MLDRKHEHLIPKSSVGVREGEGGRRCPGQVRRVGRGDVGHRRRRPGLGVYGPACPVYLFPARRQSHRDAYTNAGPQRAFRAPGHPQACFITETVIDELADRLRIDPPSSGCATCA